MNKDNVEGSLRSAVGQGEKVVGQAMNDPKTTAQGIVDDVAGKARSALGSAEDAVSAVDFSALRDEVAKLTQMVADLAQRQISAGREQMMGAMGSAGDSLAQSAAAAQDKLVAVEGDVEARIKKNPWAAVAVAALIGLLIGKMS